jgi:hypothetical protein
MLFRRRFAAPRTSILSTRRTKTSNPTTIEEIAKVLATIQANMATKSDLATVQANVENMKANMATKSDLATVQANMATKSDLATVQANMATKSDLVKMETGLHRLLQHTPIAAIQQFSKSVAPTSDVLNALTVGDTSTWTFVNAQGAIYALGCVHCALYYRTDHGMPTFVSLPRSVLERHPKRVGFLPGEFFNPLVTGMDLVAVELGKEQQGFPVESLPEWVPFPKSLTEFATVAGSSNAGYVTGERPMKSGIEGEVVFVESWGEPGNSGTLIYGVGDKPVPLGVYCGVTAPAKGMRPRGRICALRPLEDFNWEDIVQWEPTKLLVSGSRFCSMSNVNGGVVLQDGESEWPGVLIKREFEYCGSLDIGSSRAL